MRFRAGSTLIYPIVIGLTLATGMLVNVGCGGGSSEPKPNPTPTPIISPTPTPTPAAVAVKATIVWGPRSRDIGAPSSALSATLTLKDTQSNATVLTKTVDRSVQNGSQTYTLDPPVTPGNYNLDAKFFSQAGGGGTLVATAGASATVRTDGTLAVTIAFNGVITSVDVPAGQSVNIGQTLQVLYSAKDKDGNVIALTPGSDIVTIADATSTVSGQPSAELAAQQDSIVGRNPAKVTVTVKVDNATSPPTDIAVRSTTQLSVTPNPATVSILLSQQFTANLTNAPAGQNGLNWVLQEGSTAGSLDQNGLFTATRTEGAFHIVVTSVYDPNVSVVVPVTVQSLVAVGINPADFTMSIKDQKTFAATVSNVPSGQDAGVDWAVVGGDANGTITSDGVYTSPATPGDYQITATSHFDNRKVGTATVHVRSFVAITLAPDPVPNPPQNPVLMGIRETKKFKATVAGVPASGDTSVTWSVVGGDANGTITTDSNGEGVYTAPGTPGTYQIKATSNFDPNTSKTIDVKVEDGSLPITVQ